MAKESEVKLLLMLRSVPLFSTLSDKQLKTMVGVGKEMSYPKGKAIVEEGDRGVGFYLILDGNVRVRRGDRAVTELKSGEFFGEMSLFDNSPRSATVEALTDTTCFGVSAWSFMGIVKTNPDIAVSMMKELAARLRRTTKALAE